MALARIRLISSEGSEDKEGPKYTLVYNLETTDPDDGPFTIAGYCGWSYGDAYVFGNDSDPRAVAISINTQQLGSNKTHWTVTIEFGDPQFEDAENPLNAPPEVTWDYEDRQQAVERDANGTWIRNSAGDPFEEFTYADDFRRRLKITRNEATFPRTVADALGNRLNAALWNGYAAKLVKLHPIVADRAYHNLIGGYWVVKYEFTFAPIASDWKTYRRDTGIHEVVGGVKRRIALDDDSMAAVRVDLDGSGVRLATAGTPVYKEFELLYTADFDLLNLGSVDLD